ncbi:MAG: hypothetical protein R3Y13_00475 [bacterium]
MEIRDKFQDLIHVNKVGGTILYKVDKNKCIVSTKLGEEKEIASFQKEENQLKWDQIEYNIEELLELFFENGDVKEKYKDCDFNHILEEYNLKEENQFLKENIDLLYSMLIVGTNYEKNLCENKITESSKNLIFFLGYSLSNSVYMYEGLEKMDVITIESIINSSTSMLRLFINLACLGGSLLSVNKIHYFLKQMIKDNEELEKISSRLYLDNIVEKPITRKRKYHM